MNILGASEHDEITMARWAMVRHASMEFTLLASLYLEVGSWLGVRGDVGYAQAAKESNFGLFGGTDATFSATPLMHNLCGLKSHDGSATASFPDWPTGVLAHIQHLALYAGHPDYPLMVSTDPRHFPSILGAATTVEALGGHWAPDLTYGESVVSLVESMG